MKKLLSIFLLLTPLLGLAAIFPSSPFFGQLQTNTTALAVRNNLQVPSTTEMTNTILQTVSLGGNVKYVSSLYGNDTNNGSILAPWATTTNAIANTSSGTIYVMSGMYQYDGLGKNNVNWFLEPDAVIGSSVITGGPVFIAADGVVFSIGGSGSILSTNISLATTGSGKIILDGVHVSPAIYSTNNVVGSYFIP